MIIQLNKFGTTLVSRQTGKEAYSAFLPELENVKNDEAIEIDFTGVVTLSPSWGDEFIATIAERFGKDRVSLLNAKSNPSVALTLQLLGKIKGDIFKIVS
jgi:hypothetical protein